MAGRLVLVLGVTRTVTVGGGEGFVAGDGAAGGGGGGGGVSE